MEPGETWHERVSLLYSRARGKLAFERPGPYSIKVIYPLVLSDAAEPVYIESNSIRLHIGMPGGEDGRVWERIQSKDILDLIQFDDGPNQRQAVAQVVDVLLDHPKSRYRAYCIGALQRFTRQGGDRSLPPEVRHKLHTVLEIPASDLFRDDPRLDVILDIAPPNASVEDHLASWSRQAVAPLSAAAALARRPWSSSQRTFILRDEMGLLGRCLGASWTKQGEGCILTQDEPGPGEK